jgi:TPR repeat protein
MCNLGVCYEEGRGVEESGCAARDWYSRAAQSKHAEAQYRLARLFRCVTAQPSQGGNGEQVR